MVTGGLVAAAFLLGSLSGGSLDVTPVRVTTAVLRQTLEETVVARGAVGYGTSRPIVAAEAGRITSIALAIGDEVGDGREVASLNGRPAIAVSGRGPFWRPLAEGSVGSDVAELQAILTAAGFQTPVTGVFDAKTQEALRNWQVDRGFPKPDGELHMSDMIVGDWPRRVANVTASVGDFVQPGSAIIQVSGVSPVVTVAFVPSDRARVTPGDETRIVAPNGAEFAGVLGSIDNVPRTLDDGSLMYGGQVELDERPELPEGVQVRVTVVIARADDALTVPLAAIVAGGQGGPAVRVVHGKTSALVEVELGLTSGAWVEILTGLDGDETVVVAGS